jgi:hypothetical protein
MNISASTDLGAEEYALGRDEDSSPNLSKRKLGRLERDRERGYSVNVKQVVLAFVVEFVIIGLILTNIYVTIAQLPDPSTFKTIQALLFPIAMAMVELARVPLAIAVRTQNSWNMKLAALLGVLCAVAVTSNSLYSIGASSFTPRLEDTHKKEDLLIGLQTQKQAIEADIARADADVKQKLDDRDQINQSIQVRSKQLTEQPAQNCAVVTTQSPAPGVPPSTANRCVANPVLKTLNNDIASEKAKLVLAEATLKQALTERKSDRYNLQPINDKIAAAATEDRESIFQSQLHSLAAMLFEVDPKDVTPGQLKTLEFYLVFVSSIAAAFSSTLIAMTAVRRIKPAKVQPTANIPEEALTYLFGPLVAAIRQEAKDAVASAVRETSRQPNSSKAQS